DPDGRLQPKDYGRVASILACAVGEAVRGVGKGGSGGGVSAAVGVSRPGSAKPDQRRLRLRDLGPEHRVSVPPQLDEAGVVLDRLPLVPLGLIDLGQPEMRGGGVEKVVDEA